MTLQLIELGSVGEAVERWQFFLIGKDLLKAVADGRFGRQTNDATISYQARHELTPDGRVGPRTYARALMDGFDGVISELEVPPKPSFPPVLGTAERQELFGHFSFTPNPTPDNREAIQISGTWVKDHIIQVSLPGLAAIAHAPSSSAMPFHRRAAEQLSGLWQAWRAQDLLSLILTFDGSFVPRFIRGSRSVLSNHAFGSAFDINYQWNKLGHLPAPASQHGSVRLLVPIANDYGFYWGGHFNPRKDGMHFEVAKIMTSDQLTALAQKYGF